MNDFSQLIAAIFSKEDLSEELTKLPVEVSHLAGPSLWPCIYH